MSETALQRQVGNPDIDEFTEWQYAIAQTIAGWLSYKLRPE